jgi:hypothetical protein
MMAKALKIIYYSGSATIGKMNTGSAADLKRGDQVVVNGPSNPDASITAQNIQIRPAGSRLPETEGNTQ